MARPPRVRPGATGTPPGMEGIRPGSPAAIAAGYKPPKSPKSPKAPKPPKAPAAPAGIDPSKDAAQKAAIMGASGTTITPPVFKPDSSWWTKQFAADPRWLQNAPMLRAKEESVASSYGYVINRNAAGQPIFKSKASGAGGITQVLDANGSPVLDDKGAFQYKDAAGNVYSPADLEMDIQRVQRGQAGYLEGQLGGAEAGSERRQFEVGDVAARSGARRSGMRAQASDAETRALQSALAGLTTRAAGEFGGVQSEYMSLYNQIFGDLLKSVGDVQAPTETPAAPTPPPVAPVPSVPAGSVAVPGGGSANAAGQYTPPPAGSSLSPAAFDNTLNEILVAGQRGLQPMSKSEKIRALRNVYDSYTLTPQQRNRVKAELKKLGFVIR